MKYTITIQFNDGHQGVREFTSKKEFKIRLNVLKAMSENENCRFKSWSSSSTTASLKGIHFAKGERA